MTHTQAVFLAHWMSITAILWFHCQRYDSKKKKSVRRANAKRTQEKIFQFRL